MDPNTIEPDSDALKPDNIPETLGDDEVIIKNDGHDTIIAKGSQLMDYMARDNSQLFQSLSMWDFITSVIQFFGSS